MCKDHWYCLGYYYWKKKNHSYKVEAQWLMPSRSDLERPSTVMEMFSYLLEVETCISWMSEMFSKITYELMNSLPKDYFFLRQGFGEAKIISNVTQLYLINKQWAGYKKTASQATGDATT